MSPLQILNHTLSLSLRCFCLLPFHSPVFVCRVSSAGVFFFFLFFYDICTAALSSLKWCHSVANGSVSKQATENKCKGPRLVGDNIVR